jgi:hypothetical protein
MNNEFDMNSEIVNYDVFNKYKAKHFISLNRQVSRPHRYAFGLFVKSKTVHDKFVPFICIISPLVCFFLAKNSAVLFGNYVIDNELIIINGLITFIGLLLISKPATSQTKF